MKTNIFLTTRFISRRTTIQHVRAFIHILATYGQTSAQCAAHGHTDGCPRQMPRRQVRYTGHHTHIRVCTCANTRPLSCARMFITMHPQSVSVLCRWEMALEEGTVRTVIHRPTPAHTHPNAFTNSCTGTRPLSITKTPHGCLHAVFSHCWLYR